MKDKTQEVYDILKQFFDGGTMMVSLDDNESIRVLIDPVIEFTIQVVSASLYDEDESEWKEVR